jgi:hypothetical protein
MQMDIPSADSAYISELVEKVTRNPMDYVFLRRKRKFKMDDVDVTYGADEQSDFTVVFSPDLLEHQYPLIDMHSHTISRKKPSVVDMKSEYFPASDPDVQKHINDEMSSKIVEILKTFLVSGDWILSLDYLK